MHDFQRQIGRTYRQCITCGVIIGTPEENAGRICDPARKRHGPADSGPCLTAHAHTLAQYLTALSKAPPVR